MGQFKVKVLLHYSERGERILCPSSFSVELARAQSDLSFQTIPNLFFKLDGHASALERRVQFACFVVGRVLLTRMVEGTEDRDLMQYLRRISGLPGVLLHLPGRGNMVGKMRSRRIFIWL